MTAEHRQELETIVELAITRMDLKVTEALGEIRLSISTIPEMMNEKIDEHESKDERRRRWGIGTVFSILAALTAFSALVISYVK
jgi:hypothetical protein